jgi:two-component system nitrogen regulation sensor histidine kinase NtrY
MTLKAKPMNKSTASNQHKHSLEQQLKVISFTVFGLFSVLIFWIMSLLALSILMQFTIFTLVIAPIGILTAYFYHKMITPFYSLTNLVEAIRLEDYSLRARDQYQSGVMHSLSQEIAQLSNDLQQRKQIYDQHTLLIYHLIEQLDAPIAIFNHKLKLSHANASFSDYIKQPWQSKRLSSSQSLGFVLNDATDFIKQQWSFTDTSKSSQWQIKQSQFTQNEQQFYLVILTNVEFILRKNQQDSWQQIIRVMSHEIRNSLTPIKSLAQTLVALPNQEERSKQALNVIVERSLALQEFVNRYGDITQKINIQQSWIESEPFIKDLLVIFPDHEFKSKIQCQQIWADPTLLKQVVINLIKNAIEASNADEVIRINIYSAHIESKNYTIIEIIDRGQGIANPENLFVPFYTTKKQGHGIGLGLCKNIIEQHQGCLSLTNNSDELSHAKKEIPGATAKISLQKPVSSLV